MFRNVKYKDNKLDKDTALEIIKKGSYGVLSTIGGDGYPYGVPVNYAYLNKCIYFHCAHDGHKIDNIHYRENVSFCVVTQSDVMADKFDTDYESAIVFGKALKVTDNAEKETVLQALLKKYSPDFMEAGKNYIKKFWDDTTIINIQIEHITAKASHL